MDFTHLDEGLDTRHTDLAWIRKRTGPKGGREESLEDSQGRREDGSTSNADSGRVGGAFTCRGQSRAWGGKLTLEWIQLASRRRIEVRVGGAFEREQAAD